METKIFSYTGTAKQTGYVGLIVTFIVLVSFEASLEVLLITVLVPDGMVKLVVHGLHTLLIIFAMQLLIKALFVLKTRHRLTESGLKLHYGPDFKAEIPFKAIVSVQPAKERPLSSLNIRPSYEKKKQRLNAVFSNKGQVLLKLDQLYNFRIGLFKGGLADEVLLNFDHCEEFLAAFKELKATPPVENKAKVVTLSSPLALQAPFRPLNLPLLSSSATPAIRTEELTLHYRSSGLRAVNSLNLSIAPGEIYGFLGSNGAGKTTTLKMLVGLLEPSTGKAWIAGHNMWTEPLVAKASLGYVADRTMLYERLTGREFLSFLAQMRGLERQEAERRIEHLLNLLELKDKANIPCRTYSFGTKRKLALAGALLHQPAVLILDEPLNGLDPLSSHRLKELFIELATGGTTILFSTHDLATAEAVCHRVGIIHRGELVAEGSTHELRQLAAAPDLESVFLNLTATQYEEIAL